VVRGAGLAIGVALVALVILVGLAAIQVLVLMFIAVILASGLQPIIDWLRGRLPIGRGPTILIVYGLFLATVVGLAGRRRADRARPGATGRDVRPAGPRPRPGHGRRPSSPPRCRGR
jgi:hypothetical protein